MITAGTHQCRVLPPAAGWFGEAGANNTPFLRIPLLITEGEAKGEKFIYQGWLTHASLDRCIKGLVKVFPGWDGDLARLERVLTDGFFVGKPCEVVFEDEEFPAGSGKITCKPKWLNPAGGGAGGKVLDKGGVSALVEKFGARAMALATGSDGKAPTTPAAARPPADADLDPTDADDIPF